MLTVPCHYTITHGDRTACIWSVPALQMDDLEANNRSLTDDIKLVDSSDAKLRTQLTATQTSTMHTRTLSDQLTEELMMLQRVH